MESHGETLKKEQSNITWGKSYEFNKLEVGESVEVVGIEGNIRSAASNWGTRYGVWLRVEKIDDGVVRVTRYDSPISQKKLSQYERLEARLDAVATLLRLVLEKLNDKPKA